MPIQPDRATADPVITGDDTGAAPGDAPGDSLDGTRWLSYREIGKALGIKEASAKRLAIRRKWPHGMGNDGKARIAVPVSALVARDATSGVTGGVTRDSPAIPGDATGDATGEARAIIARLMDRLEAMDASIEAERTGRAADRAGWEAERAGWSLERDILAGEKATLRQELARREGELAGLREALAQPVATPLQDALERLRAWIEAKARRS